MDLAYTSPVGMGDRQQVKYRPHLRSPGRAADVMEFSPRIASNRMCRLPTRPRSWTHSMDTPAGRYADRVMCGGAAAD